MHVLITAGPTREPLDPVRFLTNRSSGKMGYALAQAFIHAGHSVLLISGPTALDVPRSLECLLPETPDPLGPFGARGMGEVPFVPLAPAVVAAVHKATGVWFDHLPIRPAELLQALQASRLIP